MKVQTRSAAISMAAGLLVVASLVLTPALVANAQTNDVLAAPQQTGQSNMAGALHKVAFLPLAMQRPSPVVVPPPATPPPGIYVATNGSDSNPGTPAAPYRSIQKGMLSARAGQTVYVRAGTYNEQVVINHGGTANSPITLRSYPGEQVTIDGSLTLTNWTQYSGSIYRAQFTHVKTQSSDGWSVDAAPQSSAPDGWSGSGDRRGFVSVDGGVGAAAWLKPVSIVGPSPEAAANSIPAGAWASDVQPPPGNNYGGATNWVYVNLGTLADANPAHHVMRIAGYKFGVVFGSGAAYVTVKGLKFQYQMNAVSSDDRPPHHIVIDSNEITHEKLRCIENMFGNNNWTVTNNNIHDNEYESIHLESDNSVIAYNSIGGTIAPWSIWGAMGINVLGNNVTVRGNSVSYMGKNSSNGHGGHGIYLEAFYNVYGHPESAQNSIVDGNRVFNCEGQGIYVSGADGSNITNNLVYNNTGHGIRVEVAGNGGGSAAEMQPTNNQLINNTSYHNTGAGLSMDSSARGTTARNNILNANTGGTVAQNCPDLVQDHNFTGNPLFVNPAAADFHLQASSTAVNAGSTSSAPSLDFDGLSRPRSGAIDCGAFER